MTLCQSRVKRDTVNKKEKEQHDRNKANRYNKDYQHGMSAAVAVVKHGGTAFQMKVMSEALRTGRLSPEKLKKELSENTPNEMRKGYDKQVKQGRTPTVDSLLAEYRCNAEFRTLAENVGLREDYFVRSAEDEIRRHQT